MVTRTPVSAEEAAAVLAAAHRAGQRVAIRGSGTKADWGARRLQPSVESDVGARRLQPSADVVLSTLGLNRIIAHRHGDLTATVEAGARLDDVNRELATHRQWIPLDPAWSDRATIGGIVATNDSGPRRHRYGAPRDLIIGVDIVRADGVRAKAGGIVVKNVAGYDLARLMTGSFGSLALITSATFKLYPLPAASRTVVVGLHSHAGTAALVQAINASQLTPTAVEIQAPPRLLLIRFESTDASVESQSAAAARLATSFGVSAAVLRGDEEKSVWRLHGERPWAGTGAVLKLTLLPSDMADVLDAIDGAANGAMCELAGRAGLGVLYVRTEGDAVAHARAIAALRAGVPIEKRSVVVLRGDSELKAAAPAGDARTLMESVRRSFDPEGVLADRGID